MSGCPEPSKTPEITPLWSMLNVPFQRVLPARAAIAVKVSASAEAMM